MTTIVQYAAGVKMRHDFSDQIQVRYRHPDGEDYDTWVSGEEALARLKTLSREQLIRSFRRLNWEQAIEAIEREVDKGKEQAKGRFLNRLTQGVTDTLGDHIFSQTINDKLRGSRSEEDPREREKRLWQQRLEDERFRAMVIEIAWRNIGDSLPPETAVAPDDWI